jgi:hypothetical protein
MPFLVIVTLMSGHLFGDAARAFKPVSSAGFLIVACAATWGVVYTSVGKQSEVAETRIKAAESVNAERTQLLARRAKAQAMLDEERKSLSKECATGNGGKCAGKYVTVGTYEDAVAGIDAKLQKLGPELPVAPKAEKMAEVIATFTGKDQAQVKRVLMLIEPFTYSLIFELCALVSFGFGFGHRRELAGSDVSVASATPDAETVSEPPV